MSVADGREWSGSRLSSFTPRAKISGAHWIATWVGSRTGMDTMENRHLSHLSEIEPRSHDHPAHKPTELRLTFSLFKSTDLLDTFCAFFEKQQAQVLSETV